MWSLSISDCQFIRRKVWIAVTWTKKITCIKHPYHNRYLELLSLKFFMNLHTSVEAKTSWRRIRWQMNIYILIKGIATQKVEELFPYHFSSFAQRGLVLSKKNKWSWHLVHLDRVIMHVPALTLIVISLHYIFISLTGQLSCLYKHLTYVQYNYHKYIWKW